jgi:hypothetical protein
MQQQQQNHLLQRFFEGLTRHNVVVSRLIIGQ